MEHSNLRAANVARDQEWNTGSERVSMTFRATDLAGEVGEACNVIKKLERERIGLVGSRDTKEHLAEELADIVICTDLVAMDAGIDLDAAIAAKFNATSEKNGLTTRLSTSPATALPFEATPVMIKAALDLVWEESETHDDLVRRLWCAMAAVAPDQPSSARVLGLEALRSAEQFIENGFEFGFIRKPDEGDTALETLPKIKAAIRALSSQDHAEAGKVEGDGWMPIESAPKDGTPFLVFVPDDKFSDGTGIDVIWYDEEQWLFGSNTPFYPANAPTHWRPLPSAPASEGAE
ncbi:hypothetical protein [Brucella intermedia]|uniref:hypothetical protein n=1 Tax=Brucella intermedia TaxID=94625 RepID=UPI0034CF065F